MKSANPRALDHLVLPTRDLKVARSRLTRLGFTVAPEGGHPFGTKNACVYFADGTFLEPLAVASKDRVADACAAGNVFVLRDLAYRYRHGEEGLSAIAYATDDAAADHAEFNASPYAGGPMLEFSRDFIDAAGKRDVATFRLAFAGDWRAPEFFQFTCQRVRNPAVDRAALQRHDNGVTRIRSVILSCPDVFTFGQFVALVARTDELKFTREGFAWHLPNATIETIDNHNLARFYQGSTGEDKELRARVVLFGVPDLRATEKLLKSHGVPCEKYAKRLIVHPAPGQGAIFAFEANS